MADVRALKDKASELVAKGKLPAALEAWQAVIAAAPNDSAAHQKVAELFVRLGRRDDAIASYETVAQRYAKEGQFFKASAVCRIVLTLDPTHVRTQELIATLYAKESAGRPLPMAAPKPAPSAPPPPKPVEVEVDMDITVDFPPIAAPFTSAPGELPTIPLFSTLKSDELMEVLTSAMEVRTYKAGEAMVKEGAPGASMFALVEGQAGIFRAWGTGQQRRVAELIASDIFGEVALMSGAPRVATVVAETDCVALEFPRDAMIKVITRFPRAGDMLDKFCNDRLLANALRASDLLRSLPDGEKRALAQAFEAATFQPGQVIVAEGKPGAAVYVLLRGTCAVTHQSGKEYPPLDEGDLFGELSALTDRPTSATVTARTQVLTLKMGAAEFKARVMKHSGAVEQVKALTTERLERTAALDRDGRV